MSAVYSITALIFAIFATATKAQASATKYDFRIFTCGALGGSYARELTSFFIAEKSEPYNYLSLDAGTSLDCIDVAARDPGMNHIFNPKYKTEYFGADGALSTDPLKASKLGKTGYFRKKQLNGFLVTHAHSDHQTGLVISSAEDDFAKSKKAVIAPKNTVAGLEKQFDPPLWPGNFFYTLIEHNPADGEKELKTLATEGRWAKSKIWIKSYFLSHDPAESTAYRICNGQISAATACVLFFGDTGPDSDELNGEAPHSEGKKTKKQNWKKPKIEAYTAAAAAVIPTVRVPSGFTTDKNYEEFLPLRHVWDDNIGLLENGVLNTIFIESSYSDERIKTDKLGLFGHLTPKLILDELAYIGGKFKKINTVPITVAVMHLKPTWNAMKTARGIGASLTGTATATETVPLAVAQKSKSKRKKKSKLKKKKSKSKKKTPKMLGPPVAPVKTARVYIPPTDGLTALIATLKGQLSTGADAKKYKSKSVNDLVNVKFVFPTSQDMIYVEGKNAALHKETSSAVPGYAPKGRVTAPRGDYYKNDYDYNGGYHTYGHNNNNNEGYGLFAAEIVLVLALVGAVGLCFIVGLTFGGGVMWIAMIKKRQEKRTN